MCMTFNIATILGSSKPACQKLLWRHEYHRTKWSGQSLAEKSLMVRQRSSTFKGEVQGHSTSHTVLGQAYSICLTYRFVHLKNAQSMLFLDPVVSVYIYIILSCNLQLFVFHKSIIHLWDYVGVDFQTIFHSVQIHCVYSCLIWLISIRSKTSHSSTVALTDKATMDASWWSNKTLVVVSGTAAVSKSSSPRRPMEKQQETQNGQRQRHAKTSVTRLNPTQVLFGQAKAFQKLGLKCKSKSMMHLGDLMRSCLWQDCIKSKAIKII